MICISTRRIFATVAAVLCLSTWVLAADDIQVGPDGNPGTPGINGNPPGAGGNGDNGGSANADAGTTIPNDDPDNTANATGGNGGDGGQGGDATGADQNGANGGNGGNGGDASATATTNSDDSFVVATATATGGTGGNGGTGGSGNGTGNNGAEGNGGDGGDAVVQASASTQLGGFIQVFAAATGGTGGNGVNGGNGGSAGLLATVTGTCPAGTVFVTAQISGGAGGNATTGMGGAGADVTLSNAVAGFGNGLVFLEQDAIGGNGGASIDGVAGIAGNASSSLIIDAAHGNQTGGPGPNATVKAVGGNGGSANTGADGGSAIASASITEPGSTNLYLTSIGGNGGDGVNGDGGNGGIASLGTSNASATAQDLPGTTVDIFTTVTGGNGGNSISGNGGTGASVTLVNAISASVGPDSLILLTQGATGGSGGATSGSGQAGIAGFADSELTISQTASVLDIKTSATGGTGGGLGASIGGPIRDAQVGGTATSIVSATNLGDGAAIAEAEATGGIGGLASGFANGGAGGAAYGSATATGSDIGGVSASVQVFGGLGGDTDGFGTDPGTTAGGAGGVATASGSGGSAMGLGVGVDVEIFGGRGGNGSNGANGGNGADASLINAADGSTTGGLTLSLVARGGDGGSAFDTGTAGLAGNAHVMLSLNQLSSQTQSDSLSGQVTAAGGWGGTSVMGNATGGGDAAAEIHLTGNGSEVTATATATGGQGAVSVFGNGGSGGNATATASAVNDKGTASAAVTVTGGSGDSGFTQGGDGRSVTLVNAVSGFSPTALTLSQEAIAGSAGNVGSGDKFGIAGDAVSNLTVNNPGTSALTASVKATGGFGGAGADENGTLSGPGGSASAMVDLTAGDGLIGDAQAIGGAAGGFVFSSGPPRSGADATAIANGTLTGDDPTGIHMSATASGGAGFPSIVGIPANSGAALARASGTETFNPTDATISDVSATANSAGGFVNGINASAHSPVNGGTSTVEARAAAGRAVPSMSSANGLQAASFVTALPSQSDVEALEKGHENVQNAFSNDGTTFVAVVDLAAKSYSTKSTTSSLFTADASLFFRSGLVPPTDFEVGLLDGLAIDGTGFQQLTFSIEVAGTVIETDNFSTLTGAVAFFHDHVINIGVVDNGDPFSFPSVAFHLTLQSTGGGDGFNTQFIVGAVPEPSTYLLTGTGLAMAILPSLLRRRAKLPPGARST